MTRGLTKERELEIERRRSIIAANVLAGLNYRDMASQLKVSIGTISNDVKIIAKRYRDEQISEYADIVQLELRRIDTALNAVWDKVKSGDKDAIQLMLMLQNQRAKYLALFAPDTDRIGLLFPSLSGSDQQATIEDIRRKRWEQVFPQLEQLDNVIDVEAQDVTDTSNISGKQDGQSADSATIGGE